MVCRDMLLQVYRFDDSEFRSHVVASSIENAKAIFDRWMGPEYREILEGESMMTISPIDGSTVLPISDDGSPPFDERTADEWIASDQTERFL